MAKFCSRCGKKLEEGAVCDCAPVTKEVKTRDAVETAKNSLFDCLNIFKKIFTKPFDAIKTFVVENKFIAGIIFEILHFDARARASATSSNLNVGTGGSPNLSHSSSRISEWSLSQSMSVSFLYISILCEETEI